MKGSRTAVILHHSSRWTEQLIQRWTDLHCHLIYTGDIHPSTTKRVEMTTLIDDLQRRKQSIDYLLINFDHRMNCRAAIDEYPLEIWREIIEKKLIQTFSLVQLIWPQMKRQHFGRILFLTNENMAKISEFNSATLTVYHGIRGLNQAVALEGKAYGITSNIIYPDESLSIMRHLRSFSDLILFLCSDEARDITGQSIPWPIDR